MSKTPTVKILVAYHKPSYLLKSDVFVPIHLGRAVAMEETKDGVSSSDDIKWLLHNMIGDDTGDNISQLNRYMCEITAQYWAWKNYDKLGNPDYIGLMHYRRHFIFNEANYKNYTFGFWENGYRRIDFPYADDNYKTNIGLNDSIVRECCANYDCIVIKEADMRFQNISTIPEDYEKSIPGTKLKDYHLMIEMVKRLYPDYSKEADELNNGYHKYYYNMFIMNKKMFNQYCEFLFSVLFELNKNIDFSDYTVNGKRTLGYLAELLFTIFIFKQRKDPLFKLRELYSSFLVNPISQEEIDRLFAEQYITLTKYYVYKFLFKVCKFGGGNLCEQRYIKYKLKKQQLKELKKYKRKAS